jgi:recombination protein RecA
MTELLKKRKSTKEMANDIKEEIESKEVETDKEVEIRKVISTGSTLLDLAISGGRVRGGGIPGGIIVELFGPSGLGKTALLAMICANAQKQGGEVRFCDPEARLDKEYSKTYGVSLKDKFEYYRPDTVSELFTKYVYHWEPLNDDVINVLAGDSVAALSTNLEMDEDDGDKMGMRRAKEFSEGLRKTARIIANKNWLVVFTNQIRQSPTKGVTTPGGMGLPFYASLRIQLEKPMQHHQIKLKRSIRGVEQEKVIGIHSICTVKKSSIDDPYRKAPIDLIFKEGIDDIRANLMWFKQMTKESMYNCINKDIKSIEKAILYIKENNLQDELKGQVIDLWLEIENAFKS